MKTTVCRALILALVLGAGCGKKEASTSASAPPVQAQTLVLTPQRVPDIYEVVGTVRPKVAAIVSAKVMAVIQQIPVKSGDAVKAGDVLARLDDREVRAAFERAQADYDRFKKLLDEGAAPPAEFQTAEERYRVSKAALSHATITAPFDGIVSEKLCDAGDLATPGKPLFTVEQPTDFRLEAYVPDRYAGAVPVGTTVHVTVEAVGGECDGTVDEVVTASDPSSRSFLVKIGLHPKKPLRSGLFGRAQLVIGERAGLFVPQSAVHEQGQLTFVYVVDGGRARMRLVKLGKTLRDQVELLSGVETGDRVIVSAEGTLNDGQEISPSP
jgi:RND family efflux transporter MFP subunit